MTNTLSISKFAAAVTAAAMLFSVVFALPARAATAEELQAQIQSLLATIAALQAQLAAMGGGSSSATGAGAAASGLCGVTFTQSHKLGDRGGQVKDIQRFLNTDPDTQVAQTGPGSPGNETSYFGPATKAAVKKFQAKYASDILAPVGLTAPTGYWGPSTMAKANAINQARCAAASNNTNAGTGTQTPTGTGVTVSAAAQPGNSLAPKNAANVPFTRFTLTAGASDVTVNSVTVELTGLADKAAFKSVALLDENGNLVGLTKTLNSNNQAKVGSNMVIPAGTSKTYTVVGNMASNLAAYAGQVAALSVVAINTTATVNGTLPITGAQHTINNSLTIGTATADRGAEDPNASKSKEIGTTNYTFQAVKITAGSAEDIRIKSVRWHQSGSASAADLANVKLYFDGKEYTPTVNGDYYTFNFGSGVVIKKGFSKEMKLVGDIVSGSGSTVKFNIRKDTDLMITGETYGYGIIPTAGSTATAASDSTSEFTDGTPWFDGAKVTITAGSFNSVSKSNEAPAANVPVQVSDTVLGAFTVDVKGEPITVEQVKFAIDVTDNAGSGLDADDITNITLVDQNGTVLAGPEDGNATDFQPTGATAAVDGSVVFSSVSFPVGQTTVFVKGRLSSDFTTDDTIKVGTNPKDWVNATGDNTGDTIAFPDVLVWANTMTVKAAALNAITMNQPPASNVVAGASDVLFMQGLLSAVNSGEDIRVSAIAIKDTTGTAAKPTDLTNIEIWADLTSANSARGDIFETRVAAGEQFTNSTAGADEILNIVLDQQITVPANKEVTFGVFADVSSSALAGAGATHTIDIDGVTAVGANTGNTVTANVTSGGQTMTITSNGVLTTTVDASSPSSKLLVDTADEQTVAVFKFSADNVEDLDIDTITFGTGNDAVYQYVVYADGKEIGRVYNSGTPVLYLNDGTLVVPKDGSKTITVKAIMNNIDGSTVTNGATVAVSITKVEVTGKGSGRKVTYTNTYTAATHNVYEAYPTVAFDMNIPTALGASAQYKVAKVDVTAHGDKDVLFGADTTVKIVARFTTNNTAFTGTPTVTVKDADGNVLWSGATGNFSSGTGDAPVTFNTQQFVVPAGQTKSLYFYIDTTATDGTNTFLQSGTGNDQLYMWFDDASVNNLKFSIDSSNAKDVAGNQVYYAEGDYVFKNDPAGPVHKD